MVDLTFSASVRVDCPPETLFDMVADVTRMGEWSPSVAACWWDEGDGPWAGSWFTGRNQTADRVWETRSQVETAHRSREFAFVVGGSLVRWGYTFTPDEQATVCTESWAFLPAGIDRFRERYGPDADAQIADRTEAAHLSIPLTLGAIRAAAEATRPSDG